LQGVMDSLVAKTKSKSVDIMEFINSMLKNRKIPIKNADG